MKNEIIIKMPKGWRKGQFMFNFLEFLRVKGIQTNQNSRLADSFHLPDEDWDKYMEEFINLYK